MLDLKVKKFQYFKIIIRKNIIKIDRIRSK
jgi:hypothetical protein